MRQLTATTIFITLLSTGCYYATQKTKFGRKDTVFAAKGEREKKKLLNKPVYTATLKYPMKNLQASKMPNSSETWTPSALDATPWTPDRYFIPNTFANHLMRC